jgi:DNA-directed RNA polymerase subunit M/transcription elongation factor TFIIS
MKKCPKCWTELHERVIGPKKRLSCPKCAYLHYENLGKTGYDVHMEKIISEIIKNGHYETELSHLANSSFREQYGGHSTAEQMDAWCSLHELTLAKFEAKDAIGKKVQMVRFARASA